MLRVAAARAERLHHLRTDTAGELSENSRPDSQQESVIDISSDEDMLPAVCIISDTEDDDWAQFRAFWIFRNMSRDEAATFPLGLRQWPGVNKKYTKTVVKSSENLKFEKKK